MLDENIPGPQRRGLPRNRDGGRRTFTWAIWAPILAEPCALLAALPTHPPHPPRLRDLPDRPTILSSVSISVDFCWRMSQGYLSARGGGKVSRDRRALRSRGGGLCTVGVRDPAHLSLTLLGSIPFIELYLCQHHEARRRKVCRKSR